MATRSDVIQWQEDVTDVIDLDSHEMIPMHLWGDAFGEECATLVAPLARRLLSKAGANSSVRDDIVGDVMPITSETVWRNKGPDTPSAIDLSRRPAVMDMMGIKRQFVFPTFALIGLNLFHNPSAPTVFGFDPAEVDQRKVGQAAIDGHNRWAAHIMKTVDGQRLRPVSIIRADSVDEMVQRAAEAIDLGIRGLWIPTVPPAGKSPADRALDPFWAMAQDNNIPILMHLGTEVAFFNPAWYSDVPEFSYGSRDSLEFPIEPFRASALHFSQEAFLTAMIFGGVFERFPFLRMGIIECGAQWVAPLADKLDMWAGQFAGRLSTVISMKPSAYLERNVRVTPFVFEHFDRYMETHPHLRSVYAYGSDFPHIEGGEDSKRFMLRRVARLGSEAVHKFFVGNGEWLLPE